MASLLDYAFPLCTYHESLGRHVRFRLLPGLVVVRLRLSISHLFIFAVIQHAQSFFSLHDGDDPEKASDVVVFRSWTEFFKGMVELEKVLLVRPARSNAAKDVTREFMLTGYALPCYELRVFRRTCTIISSTRKVQINKWIPTDVHQTPNRR